MAGPGSVLNRTALNGEVAVVGAFDSQPVGPDRLQVGSPRNEGNVVAGPGQQPSKIAADAAGSHYCDFHE